MDQHAAADEPPSPIDLAFDTDASPDRAWSMLTEPRLVAEWFTDVSPVGRIGDPYRVDFGDGSIVHGVLTEVERGRRLAYTWMWADAEPHEETLVAWSVEARDGGGTSIRLVHDGWGDAGLDTSVRDDHEGYWTGYLEDLAAVLAGNA
jgi:uncharacterized protein YndB with AHSA1/START domain